MSMKYSFIIISIPLLLSAASCHHGTGEADTDSPAEESFITNETGEVTITREQFESMDMKVGDPTLEIFSNTIDAHGYVVASPSGCANISTMIPGRVRHLNISSGDFVRKGQTLFTLEGQEVIKLQQDYAEAFYRLKLLKADYERLQMLSDERVAAEKDFLRAESEYKSVRAEVDGLKAQLKMLNIDPEVVESGTVIPFISVKSPISGTVTDLRLMLGQHLEPLESSMEIIDTDQLRLRLEVFEISIADIAVGQQVEFATPNLPERIFQATLSQIGKSVSPDSRTIECFAAIDAVDRKSFVNNMYVEATVTTREREAMAIPDQALFRDHERDYILRLSRVEGDQMIFNQIPVQTGATYQGYTEILDENLSDILLEGVYSIKPEE
jgi:cobalt-zinc-cadmium efflux system membrane fusion protein